MKRRKIITCCVFGAAILATIMLTTVGAVVTYQNEVENDDFFVGLGAAIVVILGGMAVFCESDLFFTVNYFLFKPKNTARTAFCILSDLFLVLTIAYTFFSEFLTRFMVLRKYEFVPLILFGFFVIFRIVFFVMPMISGNEDSSQ